MTSGKGFPLRPRQQQGLASLRVQSWASVRGFLAAHPQLEILGPQGSEGRAEVKQWQGGGRAAAPGPTKGPSQPRLTSALYMRMRPWFTLDQVGTALMFHSWLECSAKGPVFIWKRESTAGKAGPWEPVRCPLWQGQVHTHVHWHTTTHARSHPHPPPPNTGDRVPLGLQDPLGALHNPQSPSFFHRQKKGGVTPPPPNLALSGILFAQTLVQPPPTRQSHGHPDSTGAARAQIHRSGSPDPGSPGPAHAQGGLCHSACTCHWKSWGAGGGGGLEEGPTADDCRRAGGSCSTLRRKVYSASP